MAVVVQRQALPSYADSQTLGQVMAESRLVEGGWHGVAMENICRRIAAWCDVVVEYRPDNLLGDLVVLMVAVAVVIVIAARTVMGDL